MHSTHCLSHFWPRYWTSRTCRRFSRLLVTLRWSFASLLNVPLHDACFTSRMCQYEPSSVIATCLMFVRNYLSSAFPVARGWRKCLRLKQKPCYFIRHAFFFSSFFFNSLRAFRASFSSFSRSAFLSFFSLFAACRFFLFSRASFRAFSAAALASSEARASSSAFKAFLCSAVLNWNCLGDDVSDVTASEC